MNGQTLEILRLIKQTGPITRAEIGEKLGLSAASVSNAVTKLFEKDLLISRNGVSKKGGRRPELIEFRSTAGYVAGIDLGASWIRVAIADLMGTIVQRREYPTLAYEGGRKIISRLLSIVHELVDSIGKENVLAIGMACPGVCVGGRPWLTPFFPELKDIELRACIEEAFGIPIILENDVDMAVLGEMRNGAGYGCSDIVFLNVGVGLAAGIIIDGHLLRGKNRAAGEIGFMILDPSSARTEFREQGVGELVLSGSGIVKRYRERVGGALKDTNHVDALSADRIFVLAKDGDNAAIDAISESKRCLSIAICNLSATLNPERIIVGGGVGLALMGEMDIVPFLEHHIPFVPDVVAAKLGHDASLVGAISTAVELVEEHLMKERLA